MNFFEDIVCQENKTGYSVCGDTYLSARKAEGTVFILCDGIGSGVYANIAAITCMSRLINLLQNGVSVRAACEMVAGSMHRARTEDIPFSAFSTALLLPSGKFVVYTYESPDVVLLQDKTAQVLRPQFYTTGYEMIGETNGFLRRGDALLLSSDGVTQAGLGRAHNLGIGAKGLADYVTELAKTVDDPYILPRKILDMCAGLAENRYEDDSTSALILCREAKQLTIVTGPPSKPSLDPDYVEEFMQSPGRKVICGSSTADIVARELGKKVDILTMRSPFEPPEYYIEGIDLTTEGAITLNQAYNILDESLEPCEDSTVVERLCLMLKEADAIRLMVGNAMNEAHETMLFKQVGVRVRMKTLQLIVKKLRAMGKLVVERRY